MATMKDVALRAGVSMSTVSYALSGTRSISEDTRHRIDVAMNELGFKPNLHAQALAGRRSHILALLLAPSERGLGITELEIVHAATEAARQRGYKVMLWTTGEGPEDLRHLEQQGIVDGFLLMEVRMRDPRIPLLKGMRSVFSIIGRCEDSIGLTFTDVNFEQTMRDAFDHLRGLGHETIAFLNQSREEYDAGYGPSVRSALAFESLSFGNGNKGEAMFCHARTGDGYDACLRMLMQNPRPTALISMNDRALPGVVKALSDVGLRVPDDFSVMSIVSSARAAEMMNPSLTCMVAPGEDLGRISARQLIDMLEDSSLGPTGALVPCTLLVRDSTGPASRPPRGQS